MALTRRRVVSGLPQFAYFAAVGVVAIYVGYAAARLDMGVLGSVLASAAILVLVFTPRLPIVALGIFVLAAYGLPRYGFAMQTLLRIGLLDWLAGLMFLGWTIWVCQHPRTLQLKDWLLQNMTLFVAWSLVCLLVAWWRGSALSFSLTHHPAQFVQAWVLTLVAIHVLGQRSTDWAFGLFLCCVPILRALLQGKTGIYLDGDVAALCVMMLPIAVLGAFSMQSWLMRGAFALLGVAILAIFLAAQNRGAMVGLIFAILVLVWSSRRRRYWLVAAVPMAVVGALIVPSAYLDRFRVFLGPGAHHATAGLDRATAEGRLELWRAAWQVFMDHYGWGVGPGNSAAAIQAYLPKSAGLPTHNIFLDVATETGVVGLLLFVCLFVGAIAILQVRIRRGRSDWPQPGRRMVQAALAAYLGIGLVLSRHDMQLAYLLVGWGAALLRQRSQSDTANVP